MLISPLTPRLSFKPKVSGSPIGRCRKLFHFGQRPAARRQVELVGFVQKLRDAAPRSFHSPAGLTSTAFPAKLGTTSRRNFQMQVPVGARYPRSIALARRLQPSAQRSQNSGATSEPEYIRLDLPACRARPLPAPAGEPGRARRGCHRQRQTNPVSNPVAGRSQRRLSALFSQLATKTEMSANFRIMSSRFSNGSRAAASLFFEHTASSTPLCRI